MGFCSGILMEKLLVLSFLVALSFFGTDADIEENAAYYGNNLVYGWDNIQSSLKDCVRNCKATTGCKYWTYKHSNGWCFIKSKRDNVEEWKGATSGSVNGKTKTKSQKLIKPSPQNLMTNLNIKLYPLVLVL